MHHSSPPGRRPATSGPLYGLSHSCGVSITQSQIYIIITSMNSKMVGSLIGPKDRMSRRDRWSEGVRPESEGLGSLD